MAEDHFTSVALNSSASDGDLKNDDDLAMSTSIRAATKLMLQVAPAFVLVFGTFGNIMIILLFTRQRSASSLSLYFKALAVSDLGLLYVGCLPEWLYNVSGFAFAKTHILTCKISMLFYYTVGVLSVWLVVAMTTQRAASVLWPHRVNILCTRRKAVFYIIGLIFLICVINSHLLYGANLAPTKNGTDTWCQVDYYFNDYDVFFDHIWPWIDTLMFCLLPFIILIISNSILVWTVTVSVRKARLSLAAGQSDQLSARTKTVSSMTITLIVVSITFFVLSAPLSLYLIIKPYTTPYDDLTLTNKAKLDFSVGVFNVLWYANSAVNFYMYCLTGTKFKKEVLEMFCKQRASGVPSSTTHMSETGISGKQNDTDF